MSTARNIHVGTPADNFPLGESVAVHFHDFASLAPIKNEGIRSPKFTCAGYDWSLEIYPGGFGIAADGMVSVFLRNETPAEVLAQIKIAVMMSNGGYKVSKSNSPQHFRRAGVGEKRMKGCDNFVQRSTILNESNNILNKGTLTFVVRIIPNKGYYRDSSAKDFELSKNLFKLFGDNDIADVAFELSGNIFYGHKQILKMQAPELLQLAEQCDMNTPMPIKDVKPEVFEMMLKHLYGKSIGDKDWKKFSKQILVASDKYGFAALNLEAEAQHVRYMSLSGESAVDELLYADGNHCLELKYAVIEYIVENVKAVMSSSSFPRLALHLRS